MSRILTLEEFAERVLEPEILASVKSGRMDDAICHPDMLAVKFSPEIEAAMIERLELIVAKLDASHAG